MPSAPKAIANNNPPSENYLRQAIINSSGPNSDRVGAGEVDDRLACIIENVGLLSAIAFGADGIKG
jgi:hypothetical protein